ncbi:phosphatidylinositol 3,4,5-trisphosphate 3-phosphatase and protein-tyrosine-phosphatase PTEN2A [Neltuma alba]|uniref:phosphatidylinositol 3,4,5-trisphosphate 3-phosphatase and protein-tyrosine-phosphatase PTEN2A n=1 Tax=Neltuma alba TaxID=207710 RepID=UPI0010A45A85|nr:phosphatidylinositol 3,4,5-trisphosphate 3-phosphatase and protein-tyrosine-phosphatase PTEN2A-like [Prosopis alba]
MEPASADSSSQPINSAPNIEHHSTNVSGQNDNAHNPAPSLSATDKSSPVTNLKFSQAFRLRQGDSQTGDTGMSNFSFLTSGLGRMLSMPSVSNETAPVDSGAEKPNLIESFTKGLVDSSKTAVKKMQVKARHIVSQNKRRYQDEEFDLDLAYITENIIAMGFPAGDSSSGVFGYIEGFYRNHMEEVIRFLETRHEGKYKVYNLCSERLYDASLFKGKAASFPFDDHNCPPIELIASFCRSAYSWLKEDIQNVVVVHCKAGMGRTGVMICSLLLFLKFFPTAEEAINCFNQKRCIDGKALVLPSQIRYVKYFERTLTHFKGEVQPGRRCMLRGFRLHKCPYWIRPSITISDHTGILFTTKKHPKTKDLMPEDFWISIPKKGIVVFALPGEPGLTELAGDFKIYFNDGQGDFYCWLNTTMTENRKILDASDLDGFDKRKIPAPGFQVEVVMADYNGTLPPRTKVKPASKGSSSNTGNVSASDPRLASDSRKSKVPTNGDDDVFSDSEGEEAKDSKTRETKATSDFRDGEGHQASDTTTDHEATLTSGTKQLSLQHQERIQNNAYEEGSNSPKIQRTPRSPKIEYAEANEIKAMAADASVFSFGDEDFESD